MRLAITTENEHVAKHFGIYPGFTIAEIDKYGKVLSKNYIENPGHNGHKPGSVSLFLIKQNVDYVITEGMGAHALQNFNELGIKVILGVSGGIDETISKFLNGSLQSGESLCQCSGHTHEVEDTKRCNCKR